MGLILNVIASSTTIKNQQHEKTFIFISADVFQHDSNIVEKT